MVRDADDHRVSCLSVSVFLSVALFVSVCMHVCMSDCLRTPFVPRARDTHRPGHPAPSFHGDLAQVLRVLVLRLPRQSHGVRLHREMHGLRAALPLLPSHVSALERTVRLSSTRTKISAMFSCRYSSMPVVCMTGYRSGILSILRVPSTCSAQ